jgi:nucleoside-diphosphate kinase
MAELSTAAFTAELKEPGTGFVRQLILSFFERDKSISVYDVTNKRVFLKRMVPPEHVELKNLFPGAIVTVVARPLVITGAADDKTKRLFSTTRGTALLLVKPDAYPQLGQILEVVYRSGTMSVGRLRAVRFTAEEAAEFVGLGGSATSAASLTGDNCLAIEVTGDDIIARLHELVGPANPADAREAAPASLRAAFGTSKSANAVHASADAAGARAELAHIFERVYPFTAVATHCSAVVIRPHAVEACLAGRILDTLVGAGLEISALRTTVLSREDAGDFLLPYRTVVSEYERWVKELSSGPCIIAEVRGENAVQTVRELAGPYDAVIAKELRPGTIRATYGLDSVRNVIHCTDIERDGPLECRFLFSVVGF